jgi:hypothetical protein
MFKIEKQRITGIKKPPKRVVFDCLVMNYLTEQGVFLEYACFFSCDNFFKTL